MEQEIKIVAKLYECRDTVKSLAKMKNESYFEIIADYIEIIKAVMQTKGVDPIKAILEISKTKTYQESGMTQLLFMAAATEIMEPSNL